MGYKERRNSEKRDREREGERNKCVGTLDVALRSVFSVPGPAQQTGTDREHWCSFGRHVSAICGANKQTNKQTNKPCSLRSACVVPFQLHVNCKFTRQVSRTATTSPSIRTSLPRTVARELRPARFRMFLRQLTENFFFYAK